MVTLKDTQVERVSIPPGQRGIDATINAMAKMALGPFGAGSEKIRAQALRIIRDIPENDKRAEVIAVHTYVQKHLRYVNDPHGFELLTYPETLLTLAHGDCDDHVILEAALLGAIGVPTAFLTLRRPSDPIASHVYMVAILPGGKEITLDPIIKDKPAGFDPATTEPFRSFVDAVGVYPMNDARGVTRGMSIPAPLLWFLGGFLLGRLLPQYLKARRA